MRLLGPQSQDTAASPAIFFLSSGYRPIGSRTRLSGLSRSDFVRWHFGDIANVIESVANSAKADLAAGVKAGVSRYYFLKRESLQ